MNKTLATLALAFLSLSNAALAAEALTLPVPPESPDAALEELTLEATWDTTLEELTAADRLVVVAAAVGDKITLDPGFQVTAIEVEDLWITDAEIARRGKGVVIHPTQVGTTKLYAVDADGWVLEYEIRVEEGIEDPELQAYVVEEATPVVAEAPVAGEALN